MDKLIKFLKSFGLNDQEVKKVLQEVPIDNTGFIGTNVTKGIFETGGKKASADFPLVTETMVSPFKLDKYKGLSKEESLKKAEEALDFLDKELSRTSNLIINQNLKLAPEQKINFSNNLRMKREFEKEVEAFKTQPEATIIKLETKKPVSKEGIEQLIEDVGQASPPGTLVGNIESKINLLKSKAKDKGMTMDEILKETGASQVKFMADQNEGYVRSMARQIMFNDIKSGKLKAPKKIQEAVSGASSTDIIDPFRNIYGEDALEQLDSLIPDIKKFANEIEAEKFVRSKYDFTPNLNRPKESYTPEEMEIILKGEVPPEKKANGGRIGYAEGSDGAPSITLDTHEKASNNMDKYPIRVGDVELGISGLMTGGKNYQANPYNKISGSERNVSVRGKYNVPDTGVSVSGDIGDVRMRNTQNINAPQYNIKETIRDVIKERPYSVGVEYAPNENRNINLRYNSDGSISLRGEAKFAKGGLSYLMGF